MKVCACGFTNNGNSNICMRCGRELVDKVEENVPSYNSSVINTAFDVVPPPQIKTKKGHKGLIVLALVGLFIGAVLGIGGAALGIWGLPKIKMASHIKNAETYLAEGNYESAVSEYNEVLDLAPDKTEIYFDIAKAYLDITNEEADDDIACTYLEKAQNALKKVDDGISEDELNQLEAEINDLLYERTLVDVWLVETDTLCENDELRSENKYEYDDLGNRTVNEYYNYVSDSGFRYVYTNEYDSYGNLLRQYMDEGSSNKLILNFEYDNAGRMLKKTEFYGDAGKSETEYDTEGKTVKITGIDAEDRIIYEEEYNASGKRILHTSYRYDEDGTRDIYYSNSYEYDSDDNLIKATEYEEYQGYYVTCEYEYDANGNMILSRYDDWDDISREYSYDSKGNVLSESVYSGDVLQTKIEHKYDGDGRETASYTTDAEEHVTETVVYDYDRNGNLSRKENDKVNFDYNGVHEYTYVKVRLSQKQVDRRSEYLY